ncbi:uncharacterized protein LOC128249815 [Octopus bimaculoides]|uniref:uncharacterized protein LOC128249815 n=1 Tax=Octopus bimaculoides TaxID=37653 RepID=UPI0022E975A4|nr:uncharacterized protein LOC128249815 [Octopus bimaculoides]
MTQQISEENQRLVLCELNFHDLKQLKPAGYFDKNIIKMECQVKKNEHFRHLLLFAFNQGSKAAKASHDICAVYGEGAIAERTACDWYAKFKMEILTSKMHLVLSV